MSETEVEPRTESGFRWTYPDQFNNCVMCGAKAGEKCDTISEPGTPRETPHFYRSKGKETAPPDGYAVRDEPDHWADNCPDPATCRLHSRTVTT